MDKIKDYAPVLKDKTANLNTFRVDSHVAQEILWYDRQDLKGSMGVVAHRRYLDCLAFWFIIDGLVVEIMTDIEESGEWIP